MSLPKRERALCLPRRSARILRTRSSSWRLMTTRSPPLRPRPRLRQRLPRSWLRRRRPRRRALARSPWPAMPELSRTPFAAVSPNHSGCSESRRVTATTTVHTLTIACTCAADVLVLQLAGCAAERIYAANLHVAFKIFKLSEVHKSSLQESKCTLTLFKFFQRERCTPCAAARWTHPHETSERLFTRLSH
jgi:hypothetical protein